MVGISGLGLPVGRQARPPCLDKGRKSVKSVRFYLHFWEIGATGLFLVINR
jgi:hypothetical protein